MSDFNRTRPDPAWKFRLSGCRMLCCMTPVISMFLYAMFGLFESYGSSGHVAVIIVKALIVLFLLTWTVSFFVPFFMFRLLGYTVNLLLGSLVFIYWIGVMLVFVREVGVSHGWELFIMLLITLGFWSAAAFVFLPALFGLRLDNRIRGFERRMKKKKDVMDDFDEITGWDEQV